METTERKYTKLEELASGILTVVVETPFGDWFTYNNIHRDDVTLYILGADVEADSGESDEESRVAKHVTLRDIQRAIRTIATADPETVQLHPSFRKRFAAGIADPEEFDYDAIDSDAVMQVVMYGKVVFG